MTTNDIPAILARADILSRLRHNYENWAVGSKGPHILREAADEIDALRAQVAKLREALEPFAGLAAERFLDPGLWNDNDGFAVLFDGYDLTVGDFRRARAALGKEPTT